MAANLTRLPFIRGPCVRVQKRKQTQDTLNGHLFIPTLPFYSPECRRDSPGLRDKCRSNMDRCHNSKRNIFVKTETNISFLHYFSCQK